MDGSACDVTQVTTQFLEELKTGVPVLAQMQLWQQVIFTNPQTFPIHLKRLDLDLRNQSPSPTNDGNVLLERDGLQDRFLQVQTSGRSFLPEGKKEGEGYLELRRMKILNVFSPNASAGNLNLFQLSETQFASKCSFVDQSVLHSHTALMAKI